MMEREKKREREITWPPKPEHPKYVLLLMGKLSPQQMSSSTVHAIMLLRRRRPLRLETNLSIYGLLGKPRVGKRVHDPLRNAFKLVSHICCRNLSAYLWQEYIFLQSSLLLCKMSLTTNIQRKPCYFSDLKKSYYELEKTRGQRF